MGGLTGHRGCLSICSYQTSAWTQVCNSRLILGLDKTILGLIWSINSRNCWMTCWLRDDCGGATFTVDGQCWIKTSLAFTPQNEINVQGIVSIIKRKFLPAANTDCLGNDLQYLSGQSVLNCQQACMGKTYAAMMNPTLPKCGGFVTSPSQDCWLKNEELSIHVLSIYC